MFSITFKRKLQNKFKIHFFKVCTKINFILETLYLITPTIISTQKLCTIKKNLISKVFFSHVNTIL